MTPNASPDPIQADIRNMSEALCLPLDRLDVHVRDLILRAKENARAPEIGMSEEVPILRRFIWELTEVLKEPVLDAMKRSKADEGLHAPRKAATLTIQRALEEPDYNFTNDKSHLDPRNWDFREGYQFACSLSGEVDWRLVMLGVLAVVINEQDKK